MRRIAHVFAPALTATLLAVLAACDSLPEGASDVDGQALADAPALAHLGAVLGDDVTAFELVARGHELPIDGAPDPTALLAETNALDDERPATGGTSLRVLTQNVGMLDAKVLWVVDYARTPLLDERRAELLDVFLRDEPDVVLLQEVWVQEDVARFQAGAEERGYRASTGERGGHNDGLMILVKESLGELVEEGNAPYDAQDGIEYFPGPGIKRGYQWVRVEHEALGPIVVFNTHMQAFPNQWQARAKQSRQLGIAVERAAGDDAIALVGGDLNAGPYYRDDTWTLPDGAVQADWWRNALSYPLLLAYGGLVDAAIMGRPAEDADADVVLGDTLDELRADLDAWCEATPHVTFTATDCNSLYVAQYGGEEAPARLDHLHVRDPDGRVRATGSSLVFTAPETFGDVETEPSDHYGVLVDLVVDGT